MTRIPIGMYQPIYSMIHDINDTVKLICFLLLTASVLATNSVAGFIAAITVTAAIIYLAQINASLLFARFKRSIWLFASVIIMNTMFFSRVNAWCSWWVFAPSLAGLIHGVCIATRTALILCIGTLLTATTTPIGIYESAQRLLSPLNFLRVPTGDVAVILSASIQFIPTLFEEAELIRKGQTSRAAKFERTGYFDRAHTLEVLIVPIFVAAFSRAFALAESMEARGYQSSATAKKSERISLAVCDYAALTVSLALCALEFIVL